MLNFYEPTILFIQDFTNYIRMVNFGKMEVAVEKH